MQLIHTHTHIIATKINNWQAQHHHQQRWSTDVVLSENSEFIGWFYKRSPSHLKWRSKVLPVNVPGRDANGNANRHIYCKWRTESFWSPGLRFDSARVKEIHLNNVSSFRCNCNKRRLKDIHFLFYRLSVSVFHAIISFFLFYSGCSAFFFFRSHNLTFSDEYLLWRCLARQFHCHQFRIHSAFFAI